MKVSLVLAFAIFLASAASAEVTSLSTGGPCEFVRLDAYGDGWPGGVSPSDTFGSPDWYKSLTYLNLPDSWTVLSGGTVVSNAYGDGPGPDAYRTFGFQYVTTYPPNPDVYQPWQVGYCPADYLAPFDEDYSYGSLQSAWFPGRDLWKPLWLTDEPDPYIVQVLVPEGPGSFDYRVCYHVTNLVTEGSSSRWVDTVVTNCISLFPARDNHVSTEDLYGVWSGELYSEIWRPGLNRLTGGTSRSAMLASYLAYFERMYYASRGDAGRQELLSDWDLYGFVYNSEPNFASPNPNFVFAFDYWSSASDPLDCVLYDPSAYREEVHGRFPRRMWPATRRLLETDADLVHRLCKSVCAMWPPFVEYAPLNPAADLPEGLRRGTAFLGRPQWTLDGRENPFTRRSDSYFEADYSMNQPVYEFYEWPHNGLLWWSSRVPPPPVEQQFADFYTYTPTASELARVLPEFEGGYYDVSGSGAPGVDKYIYYDFPFDYKAASGGFVFDLLETSTRFQTTRGDEFPKLSPVEALWSSIDDVFIYSFVPSSLVNHYSTVAPDGTSSGWTYEDFLTNAFPKAAKSLPYSQDAFSAWLSGFDSAVNSIPFRIDSAPLAVADQALALMDRTVSFPLQAFVCTNVELSAVHEKQYVTRGPTGILYSVTWNYEPVAQTDTGFEYWGSPAVEGSGEKEFYLDATNATFNVTESLRKEQRFVKAYANPVQDLTPPYSCLGDTKVSVSNEPVKSIRVGDTFPIRDTVPGLPVTFPGVFLFADLPEPPRGPAAEGPFIYVRSLAEDRVVGKTFVFSHYPDDAAPVVSVYMDQTSGHVSREWEFGDYEGTGGGQCGLLYGAVPKVPQATEFFSADAHIGWLAAMAVCSERYTSESYYGYHFTKFRTGEDGWDDRSDLEAVVRTRTSDLVQEASSEMYNPERGILHDPRDPDDYAPIPDRFTQKCMVGDTSGEKFADYWMYSDCTLQKDVAVSEDRVKVIYEFDVETQRTVDGYSEGYEVTNVTKTMTYHVTEWWSEVRGVGGTKEFNHVETNSAALAYHGSAGPFVETESEKTVVAVTNRITVAVWEDAGGTPYFDVKVIDRTTRHVEVRTSAREEAVTVGIRKVMWRDPDTGEMLDLAYSESRPETREDRGPIPFPFPAPGPRTDTGERTYYERIALDPSDAVSVTRQTVRAGTVLHYYPLFHVGSDGKVDTIEIRPQFDDQPQEPNVDEFVVAPLSFASAEFIANLLSEGEVEYEGSDDGTYNGELGSFSAVLTFTTLLWLDWDWGALRIETSN